MLLVLLLFGTAMVSAVSAEPVLDENLEIETENEITELHKDIPLIMYDPAIKNATPYWILLVGDTEGQKVRLSYIENSGATGEEKKLMKEFLNDIWKKYPVEFIKNGKDTYIQFDLKDQNVKLTEEENSRLEWINKAITGYLNEKYGISISPKWWGNPGHSDIAYITCTKIAFPYPEIARDVADDPDLWPSSIPTWLPQWFQDAINQLYHSWNHYYNPDNGFGAAPQDAASYANTGKTYYDQGQTAYASQYFGWSSHFITDVGNPLHTGYEYEQWLYPYIHYSYEEYVGQNWHSGEGQGYYFESIVDNNNVYIYNSDIAESTRNLASYSHQYDDTLFCEIYDHPDTWNSSSSPVKSITENCLLQTAKRTLGLAKYIKD
ncbi:MAG: hypothetical protein QMC96_13215 [Methanomicrobiales archaeon]|nr:hypothetical protein [Methanomicrobiales archaeon]